MLGRSLFVACSQSGGGGSESDHSPNPPVSVEIMRSPSFGVFACSASSTEESHLDMVGVVDSDMSRYLNSINCLRICCVPSSHRPLFGKTPAV